ncbi:MAG: glutaredoxin 3 [Gammaproteobacteria bacterium]|nr:glutaredoxin 3 [Gammaproteobacteria bacterium]|tara:strand:+ start:979 stop:1227 length:249 start_codon:yes stop_codon:yes gene_type:complete
MKAKIYSTKICPYCVRAKMLLEKRNIKYIEYKVDEDSEKYMEMLELSGGRQSVPQIFLDEKHIGGYDDLVDLDMEGGLDINE